MDDTAAGIAPAPPVTAEEIAKFLAAAPPAPPRYLREALPGAVERLVNQIAASRRAHEANTLLRGEFASLMKELNSHLQDVVTVLEFLRKHADTPWIAKTAYGPEGMLDALGNEPIERLRKAAALAERWQKAVGGSGRRTLAEALGEAGPELISATAGRRLRQLLHWPRGKASNQRQLALCEQLWQAAGGTPSASIKRWGSYLSFAKGHKQRSTPEAIMVACLLVDRVIGSPLSIETKPRPNAPGPDEVNPESLRAWHF
jgi:hypothetical protein